MGPQNWLKRLFIMQKKTLNPAFPIHQWVVKIGWYAYAWCPKRREDVGNTLDFQPSIRLREDGFNGIERDQAPFHPGRIIFLETPLGSQSFESCSLLIENMATFGTDAD